MTADPTPDAHARLESAKRSDRIMSVVLIAAIGNAIVAVGNAIWVVLR